MLIIKRTFVILFIFATANIFGQQNLKFKISGLKDTTVFLARYFGEKLYYADTAFSKMKQSYLIKKAYRRNLCSSMSKL